VELFRNCSQDFVKALMAYVETRVYSRGDVIFQQGDEGDCMFLLHKGQVEVTKDGTSVTTLESGDVFGEMAILSTGSRGRRCAAVTAITVCDCRVIRQGAFLLLLKHYPTDREVFASEARRREEMNKVKEEHCFRKPVQPVKRPPTALRPNKPRKTLPSLCDSKPVDDAVRRVERRRSTSARGNMHGKIISAWQPDRGRQQTRVFTLEAIQASVSRQSNSECERASHSCGTPTPSQDTQRKDCHQRAETITLEAMDSEPERATNSGGAPTNSRGNRGDEEESYSLVVHPIQNLCQRLRSNSLHGREQSETRGLQAVTRTCEACPREFLVSGELVIEFGARSGNAPASLRSAVVSPSAPVIQNEAVSLRESLSPKEQLSPNSVLSPESTRASSPVHRCHTGDNCNPRCGHSRRPTDKFTDIDPDSDRDADQFPHVAAVSAPKEPKSKVKPQEPISHFRASHTFF